MEDSLDIRACEKKSPEPKEDGPGQMKDGRGPIKMEDGLT